MTQTFMPRSNVSFKSFIDPKNFHPEECKIDDEYATNIALDDIEYRMKSKNKLLRQKSIPKSNIDTVVEDEFLDVIAIEAIPTVKHEDSEYEDSIQEDSYIQIRKNNPSCGENFTFNSWNNLNFSNGKKGRMSDATPWSNFQG
jgi:hypothetical protein